MRELSLKLSYTIIPAQVVSFRDEPRVRGLPHCRRPSKNPHPTEITPLKGELFSPFFHPPDHHSPLFIEERKSRFSLPAILSPLFRSKYFSPTSLCTPVNAALKRPLTDLDPPLPPRWMSYRTHSLLLGCRYRFNQKAQWRRQVA